MNNELRTSPVLVSWIARNNDPYEKDRLQSYKETVDGKRIPGPTLNLLFHEDSCYCGKIKDVFLLHQDTGIDRAIYDELCREIQVRDTKVRVEQQLWKHDDPTDHEVLFPFIREVLEEVRSKYPGRELVIHISPGTPSMQTIWVLTTATGFLDHPFTVVKSYRPSDRKNQSRPVVAEVSIDIDTCYKRYMEIPLRQNLPDADSITWDPQRFNSSKLKELYDLARRYALVNVPVIILGERGTGKTTLASWIRSSSSFRRKENDRDWPILACGQYQPQTMRSELFGYVKGAFTGADNDKEGMLVKANKDTLLLDEIGDISRDLQRLLIKAIEEKKFSPMGSTEFKESNFRLITATNQPWDVLQERLDPDFLDRISYFRLTVPPIREIPEDIPWLWDNIFKQAITRTGIPEQWASLAHKYHDKIIRSLQRHPLPGNLRDLYQVAYNLLACLADKTSGSPSFDEAVSLALNSLASSAPRPAGSSLARVLAGCFAASRPLDALVGPDMPLDFSTVDGELKAYIASELFRIARQHGVPVETICSMTRRTLNNWRAKQQ